MLEVFLDQYIQNRPVFLGLIRVKEAQLFQKYLPLKSPVLDYGCGDGFFASVTFGDDRLARIDSGFARIDVGLDIKDSRIEEAGEQRVYKKLVTYDGNRIPFKDKTFAIVISNCVLEHLPNLDNSLKEIHRVLKPGGSFITTVATKNWEEYLFGNLILGDFYKKWMRKKQVHINLLTHQQWRNMFERTGFSVKEETGYLDKTAVRWIDIWHYLSIGSLISYKLFKRWTMVEKKRLLFPASYFSRLVAVDLPPEKSGNIFYYLCKKS